MKIRILGLAGVLLVVGVLVFGLVGTAFSNPTAWDFDSVGDGTEASPYIMNHQDAGIVESGYFDIGATETICVRSNQPCNLDTDFLDGAGDDFILELITNGNNPSNYNVTIGTWTSGSFNVDGYQNGGLVNYGSDWSSGSKRAEFSFEQDGLQTVLANQYLCLKIVADGATGCRIITTDSGANTFFNYNYLEDPQWPVPEIITITTISLAALGLGGFIWYRRRQPVEETVA